MRIGGAAGATKAPKPAKAAPVRAVGPSRPSGGTFIGLDIGTQNIKVIEVRGSGKSLQVTGLAMGDTPPGAIQQGIVTDAKALGAAIKQICQKNGIRSNKVIAAAAGSAGVVVRVIEVPKMTPSELAETMKWEVERHIPFPVNDVEMAYQSIDDPALADPNAQNMEVLLAVAQRDMVAAQLSTLETAGLRPVAIDVEPLAIGRSLLNLSREGLAGKNVVIVNIGAANTDVAVFKSGILRFPRSIPIAGDNFTRAIADTLGLSLEQAEAEKRLHAAVLMDVLAAASAPSDNDPFGSASPTDSTPPPFVFDSPFADASVPPPLPTFGAQTAAKAPDSTDEMAAGNAPANPFADTPNPFADAPNPFAATPNPFAENPFAVPVPESEPTLADPASATVEATTLPAPVVNDPQAIRRREIFDALLPILDELSMEIKRSVDYFSSRYPTEAVDLILVGGGSARIANIDQFLQSQMGVPTTIANPFAGVSVASKQLSSVRLSELAPFFPVALGLAARDAVLGAEK
ncbi:MAG: type IV pilus assembly protein PilM [Armatimonadota bacterium]